MGQQSSRTSSRHDGETQRLLPGDADEVVQEIDHDQDGCFPRHGPHDVCPANPYADLPVYTTIHRYVVVYYGRFAFSCDIVVLRVG